MKRRYESYTKRSFPVVAANSLATSSFKPKFNTVSIIPGIEILAPERTDTNNGFFGSPKVLPVISSSFLTCSTICPLISSEIIFPSS